MGCRQWVDYGAQRGECLPQGPGVGLASPVLEAVCSREHPLGPEQEATAVVLTSEAQRHHVGSRVGRHLTAPNDPGPQRACRQQSQSKGWMGWWERLRVSIWEPLPWAGGVPQLPENLHQALVTPTTPAGGRGWGFRGSAAGLDSGGLVVTWELRFLDKISWYLG